MKGIADINRDVAREIIIPAPSHPPPPVPLATSTRPAPKTGPDDTSVPAAGASGGPSGHLVDYST